MSEYYRGLRNKGFYEPGSKEPFRLSRSKIDMFVSCPRCFYIDRRLGLDRPPGFPFAINAAVDTLLKKEFDLLRKAGTTHPLIKKFGIDARPAPHEKLDEWRENFKGVRYLHEATGFVVTGAIDDLWIDSKGNYIVVDYKATAKGEPVTELGDASYHDGYRRQMEIYQWLLRKNGLKVSDTGYFVYCTGKTGAPQFDARVDFDIHIIPYTGSDAWIEEKLGRIKETLDKDEIPAASKECDYCLYYESRLKAESGK